LRPSREAFLLDRISRMDGIEFDDIRRGAVHA
jgi:hypothetical protein